MPFKIFNNLSTGSYTFLALIFGTLFFQLTKFLHLNYIKNKEERDLLKKIEEKNKRNIKNDEEINMLIQQLEEKNKLESEKKKLNKKKNIPSSGTSSITSSASVSSSAPSSSSSSSAPADSTSSSNFLSYSKTQDLYEDEALRRSIIDEQNYLYNKMIEEHEKEEKRISDVSIKINKKFFLIVFLIYFY